MDYRNDINGLRAIAVIGVVLYHFNPSWLSGGFSGVDVFFVISGFLMTGIIFRGLEGGNFSILSFYQARARRIIPALALVCFVVLIIGWFYAIPLSYRTLGKHVAFSMIFISNIQYGRESGYFDSDAHEKWLLHTWSLSAEWQFYIFFPIILVLLAKYMPLQKLKLLIVITTVVGLIFSVIGTNLWPTSAYYLLPFRAWEMLLGGVAYLFPFKVNKKLATFYELSGVALIISSFYFITSSYQWPGFLAIIPTIGAFLLIQAHNNHSLITSNFIFQHLGKWSYSLYLWHWPIVALIYYFSLGSMFTYLGILLSVLMGFLSYKYVESFYSSFNLSGKKLRYLTKPITILLIVGLLGFAVYSNKGFLWHYPDNIVLIGNEERNRHSKNCNASVNFPCILGNPDNIKAIIVGDSHAESITSAITSFFNLDKEGVVALTDSGCPFILGMKIINKQTTCAQKNEQRMKLLADNYQNIPVFWSARLSYYFYDDKKIDKNKAPTIYFTKKHAAPNNVFFLEFESYLNKTVKEISQKHPLFLIHPIPEMKHHVPKSMAKNLLLGNNNFDPSSSKQEYLARNQEYRDIIKRVAKLNNIIALDPSLYLCDKQRCIAEYNNRPIYHDDDHLSEYGNKLLLPMLEPAISSIYPKLKSQ